MMVDTPAKKIVTLAEMVQPDRKLEVLYVGQDTFEARLTIPMQDLQGHRRYNAEFEAIEISAIAATPEDAIQRAVEAWRPDVLLDIPRSAKWRERYSGEYVVTEFRKPVAAAETRPYDPRYDGIGAFQSVAHARRALDSGTLAAPETRPCETSLEEESELPDEPSH